MKLHKEPTRSPHILGTTPGSMCKHKPVGEKHTMCKGTMSWYNHPDYPNALLVCDKCGRMV